MLKQLTFFTILAGLCIMSSCNRKSNTAKMAEMNDCQKIEFGFQDIYSGAKVIDDLSQIKNIIGAIQRMEHYVEGYETQILFTSTMRATCKRGKTITVYYAHDNVAVFFRDGKSKELYKLLTEYGIIDPSAPVIIGHPDFTEQEKKDYERAKDGD